MPVTELELFLIILLDTITSFFIGAIIGGNLVRFPFRTRSYAGVESIIWRRCRVSSVSGKRIEVVANSQIWAAVAVNEGSGRNTDGEESRTPVPLTMESVQSLPFY